MTSLGFTVVLMGLGLAGAGGAVAWDQLVREPRERLEARAEAITGGDARHGRLLVQRSGCAGCHEIEGVAQPGGMVGPPLSRIASRAIIGGKLENRPDNLMLWLQDPQGVSPGTAMPDLGLTPAEARDVSAFLYTLE